MGKILDCCIIGAGVAGAFASLRMATEYPKKKVVVIDIGRPWMKRRQSQIGWLGCLPHSDGKLYQSDIQKVAEITGLRNAKKASTWAKNVWKKSSIDGTLFPVIEDKSPQVGLSKKFEKLGFGITTNDYVQVFPKDIHALSKYMANILENQKNIDFDFDCEVMGISKQDGIFTITTSEDREYQCKKIILAVGRSGWRWAKSLYASLGLIESDDIAHFGIRVEMDANILRELNGSNCLISRKDLELGPFSWGGTIIQEDHVDMAISSFRSNEDRWKTDKVSFSLIGNRSFPKGGFDQTDRIAKLTFLLANDRVSKERVSAILKGTSKISIIHEYDWLKETIKELATIIPEIATKAYFHVPTITPLAPSINLGDNLETEVPGLFVAGESSGIIGLLASAISGILSADAVCAPRKASSRGKK